MGFWRDMWNARDHPEPPALDPYVRKLWQLTDKKRRLEKRRDLLIPEERNIELAREVRDLEERKRLREENRG